ncbi:MAG TPA: OB-fold domain-containing protein, partial [Burkholderiales bacterium]|nr:OB-fold domain-containing protein [Burkholderiales bacterium]
MERPIPVPDAATAPYWSAANEGRLVLPRCTACSRWHFYPRALCPYCSSDKLEWQSASGRGEVYSYTVVHRAPSPAFAAEVPYVVAIVELEEGPHLMT